MNVPKRYLWIAAGAAAGFGLMLLKKKLTGEDGAPQDRRSPPPSSPKGEAPKSDAEQSDGEGADAPAEGEGEPASSDGALTGAVRDLTEFLAGESWFDEMGWQGVWEREGIDEPEAWLKDAGLKALKAERKKLVDHPALLAGCRRRWIVVCRYAGIDVSEAASLWSSTDDA